MTKSTPPQTPSLLPQKHKNDVRFEPTEEIDTDTISASSYSTYKQSITPNKSATKKITKVKDEKKVVEENTNSFEWYKSQFNKAEYQKQNQLALNDMKKKAFYNDVNSLSNLLGIQNNNNTISIEIKNQIEEIFNFCTGLDQDSSGGKPSNFKQWYDIPIIKGLIDKHPDVNFDQWRYWRVVFERNFFDRLFVKKIMELISSDYQFGPHFKSKYR